MEKDQVSKTLKTIKDNSPKRNFKQTIDLIINLKDFDMKKVQVNQFVTLHFTRGKKVKVCALVGPELISQAKEVCDGAISVDDFEDYKEKAKVKKLAKSYDYFVAQANIMPKIATAFGRVFGPKGKMPNPKAGCVVPPNSNLKPLYEKLQKTVRVQVKNHPLIQCAVGKEDSKDEEAIDNILVIYDSLIHTLPNGMHNIKDMYLKLTMGEAFKIGEESKKKSEEKKEEPKPKKAEAKKEEPKK